MTRHSGAKVLENQVIILGWIGEPLSFLLVPGAK
jgi:hypothetical protein